MSILRKRVPPELAGPLDRAVRALFGTTWGKARAWITGGKVLVGGVVVTDCVGRVVPNAEVELHERASRPRPRTLGDDQVLYVDAQVVVVAKPSGVSTVPYGDLHPETDTLDARVRAWLERRGLSRRGARPNLGVVHRLDKETSGVVVFTRTWLAKRHLALQFRRHTVHRRYVAIAYGAVAPATLRTWFVEDRGDGLRGSCRGKPPPDAREAITHVDPVERLGGATLVACRLETGRTHQIRIHLSESGHPIVGERVYLRGAVGSALGIGLDGSHPLGGARRLMLHAAELGFVHPATERPVSWQLAVPDDMQSVIDRLREVGKARGEKR